MEDLIQVAEPETLDSAIVIADGTEAVNDLEPIEIFIEQPDGSKVRISFLANGEIEGDPQNMLPQTYEPALSVEEASGSLDDNGSELLATFVNSESSQQVSAIQTPDGQIYYIESYPSSKSGKEPQGEQSNILYTLLPKELYPVSESDQLKQTEENALAEQMTKDSLYTIAREKLKPFVKVHKARGRTESSISQIGSELHLEEKMAAMAAMLPAAIAKPHGSKKAIVARKSTAEKSAAAKDEAYRCDMCDAAFGKPQQFYGHSKTHSIERQLRCSHCPDDTVFAAHSKLSQHERRFHISVRSHVCSVCDASFDRPSQLVIHMRRIHMQERPHSCPVCQKAFFKLSDLRSHLNIHFGLNVKVCDTCGKRFNHVSNLNRHLRIHSGARPFVCATCGRRFMQQSGLAMHEQVHRPPQTVSCPVCQEELKNETALRGHVRLKHSLQPLAKEGVGTVASVQQRRKFYCRVCGQVFPFSALLKNHEASHAKQETFRCSWCKLDLTSAEQLKTHACQPPTQRAAQAVLDAEAEQSLLDAQMESLLGDGGTHDSSAADDIVIYVTQEGHDQPTQVHIKPMAAGRFGPIAAEAEPDATLEKVRFNEIALRLDEEAAANEHDMLMLDKLDDDDDDQLQVSLGEHDQLEMSLGEHDQSFDVDRTKEEDLRFNFKDETDFREGPLEDDEVLADGDDQYPVEGENPTDAGSQLLGGMRTMDVTITVLPVSSESTSAGPRNSATKIYKCPECVKTFFKHGNYKQHLGMHYAHAKRHLCPVCGQSFAWQSTMRKHLANHDPPSQRQKFCCPICQKEYLMQAQVQNHIKRDHWQERSHKCATCSKSFFKKNDLNVHLRTHTKEMPYICGTCGKRFGHVSHIIRHELIHSGHRPYPCPDCGKRFTQSNTLKVHRASHACKTEPSGDTAAADERKKPPKAPAKRVKTGAKDFDREPVLTDEDLSGGDSHFQQLMDSDDVGAQHGQMGVGDLNEFILPHGAEEVVFVALDEGATISDEALLS